MEAWVNWLLWMGRAQLACQVTWSIYPWPWLSEYLCLNYKITQEDQKRKRELLSQGYSHSSIQKINLPVDCACPRNFPIGVKWERKAWAQPEMGSSWPSSWGVYEDNAVCMKRMFYKALETRVRLTDIQTTWSPSRHMPIFTSCKVLCVERNRRNSPAMLVVRCSTHDCWLQQPNLCSVRQTYLGNKG